MALTKLILNPGINKESTDLVDKGGWVDGNLIRFRKGLPEKIGGWSKSTTENYEGTGRALTAWVALDGTRYLGLGTTYKYYVTTGDILNDVTPIRVTTGNNEISFAATNGSSTLVVTDTAHGAAVNDFVTYSGCATLGGLVTAAVLNQEYQIIGITSANVYTITAKDTSGDTVTANASDSGNGQGTTVGAYQINVGLDVYVQSTGWGAGTWGAGTFGSSSAISETGQLRLWSHDAFGEDLIINPRAGNIYYWDESSGTSARAVDITTLSGANLSPTKGLQTIVSDVDRHVIVLGADPISGSARTGSLDPLLIAFSSQESVTDWEPTSTNTAGSLRLSSGSQIVGGLRARQEILIWTDTALYSMQFVGAPFTFGVNLINENVGLISPNGFVNAPDAVYWMARDGFYTYTGSVQRLQCSVLNYVLDDFNSSQSFKVTAFTNKEFNEAGWFYPSSSSTEIDRYVTYNYLEKVWSIGELSRTAWLDDGIFQKPRATGKDSSVNYIYTHEDSDDADGSPMDNVFIESGDIDINDGEKFGFVRKIIPDVKFFGTNSTGGQINFVLKTRNFPGDTLTTNSTNDVTSSTQQNYVRARSRQMVFRVQSDDDASTGSRTGFKWRLGANRLEIRPDGKR
jgi:hypothetical protein|tara:strand:- start:208 stop:2091 length:1884 start_codon:yes stop_codon:yes gene_type:complete